jgi:hypothetical protein
MLRPFLIAMVLMYVALISQPIWATQRACTGGTAHTEHIVCVYADKTEQVDSSILAGPGNNGYGYPTL